MTNSPNLPYVKYILTTYEWKDPSTDIYYNDTDFRDVVDDYSRARKDGADSGTIIEIDRETWTARDVTDAAHSRILHLVAEGKTDLPEWMRDPDDDVEHEGQERHGFEQV